MKQSFLYALASALITAAALLGTPAFAQESHAESRTYVSTVRTADLDLRSESGQRQLQHRLARAARDVCGVASDADLEGRNDLRNCRAEAIARASEQRDQVLARAGAGSVITVAARR